MNATHPATCCAGTRRLQLHTAPCARHLFDTFINAGAILSAMGVYAPSGAMQRAVCCLVKNPSAKRTSLNVARCCHTCACCCVIRSSSALRSAGERASSVNCELLWPRWMNVIGVPCLWSVPVSGGMSTKSSGIGCGPYEVRVIANAVRRTGL